MLPKAFGCQEVNCEASEKLLALGVIMKGLVHVYTGDGKGKTTAAFGLALRRAGSGGRVFIIQFLKGKPSGEAAAIKKLGVEHLLANPGIDFVNNLSRSDYKKQKEMAEKALINAEAIIKKVDMLILDEIICAVNCGFLALDEVLNFIKRKPGNVELVLTGVCAPCEICEIADYVTVMQKKKHPYDSGICARSGIEF